MTVMCQGKASGQKDVKLQTYSSQGGQEVEGEAGQGARDKIKL